MIPGKVQLSGGDRASMRPRPVGLGNDVSVGPGRYQGLSFNEAEARGPRKWVFLTGKPSLGSRFNEAEARGPRKCSETYTEDFYRKMLQ